MVELMLGHSFLMLRTLRSVFVITGLMVLTLSVSDRSSCCGFFCGLMVSTLSVSLSSSLSSSCCGF